MHGRPTVAVLGTGIDVPFPPGNRRLMERIAHEGVVVSEYPPGTKGKRCTFPHRNRIVAGLSLGTLVIEAAFRSGALITARLAADAGREVFATPGSIRNPMARGCHRLLREGVTWWKPRRKSSMRWRPSRRHSRTTCARADVPTSSRMHCNMHYPTWMSIPSACGMRSATTQPLWKPLSCEPD